MTRRFVVLLALLAGCGHGNAVADPVDSAAPIDAEVGDSIAVDSSPPPCPKDVAWPRHWVQEATVSTPYGIPLHVAIDSERALVGSVGWKNLTGRAQLLERSGGSWTAGPTLQPAEWQPNDYAGASGAISGSIAIVGAPGKCCPAGPGSAYVFERVADSWVERQRLVASDGGVGFGSTVALADDALVVGGASVYVFRRGADGFREIQILRPSGSARVVAFDGETIAAGGDSGDKVSIYTRAAAGWTLETELVPSAATDGKFGYALGVSKNTVIVGAAGKWDGSPEGMPRFGRGAAYVFERSAGLWKERLRIEGTGANDWFGCSVAIQGGIAAVADCRGAGAVTASHVVVLGRRDGNWIEEGRWELPRDRALDRLDTSIAVSCDTVLLARPRVIPDVEPTENELWPLRVVPGT